MNIELEELDVRALRFAINIVKSLVYEDKLEIYDWQAESLEKVMEELKR